LAVPTVRRVVEYVLTRLGRTNVEITVTFLSSARMRALNRRTFGRDRTTDVVAFGLPHAGTVHGDVYVCPAVARRSAERLGVPVREELVRLVVHGTLHVLGFDHPGPDRRRTRMWRLQEACVRELMAGKRGRQ